MTRTTTSTSPPVRRRPRPVLLAAGLLAVLALGGCATPQDAPSASGPTGSAATPVLPSAQASPEPTSDGTATGQPAELVGVRAEPSSGGAGTRVRVTAQLSNPQAGWTCRDSRVDATFYELNAQNRYPDIADDALGQPLAPAGDADAKFREFTYTVREADGAGEGEFYVRCQLEDGRAAYGAAPFTVTP